MSRSEVINTEILILHNKQIRAKLSDRDRRLFNHAKVAIAQETESLDDCELFIDFEDQDGLTIQTNSNPSGRIFVGYDGNDSPKYVWERRGFWRAIKNLLIDSFYTLLKLSKRPLAVPLVLMLV